MGGDHDGDGPRGGHGKGMGMGQGWGANYTAQTVTVNVPNDGKSYLLVVTEAAPTAPAGSTTGSTGSTTTPTPKAHSEAIALTGTGSQTVTLPPMHTGKFTLKLVAVSGSSVSGEIGTDGKLVAPITVG
jgi:hypothetical protein